MGFEKNKLPQFQRLIDLFFVQLLAVRGFQAQVDTDF